MEIGFSGSRRSLERDHVSPHLPVFCWGTARCYGLFDVSMAAATKMGPEGEDEQDNDTDANGSLQIVERAIELFRVIAQLIPQEGQQQTVVFPFSKA